MQKTEYIITGQVLRDFPTDSDNLREAADQADWTVCKTYEAAKYRAEQWRKRIQVRVRPRVQHAYQSVVSDTYPPASAGG